MKRDLVHGPRPPEDAVISKSAARPYTAPANSSSGCLNDGQQPSFFPRAQHFFIEGLRRLSERLRIG